MEKNDLKRDERERNLSDYIRAINPSTFVPMLEEQLADFKAEWKLFAEDRPGIVKRVRFGINPDFSRFVVAVVRDDKAAHHDLDGEVTDLELKICNDPGRFGLISFNCHTVGTLADSYGWVCIEI